MNQGAFEPLGTFGGEEMMGLGNLANWAGNIATGGNVQTGGSMPDSGLLGGGATQFFSPFTSGGGSFGGGGSGGAPGTQSFLSGANPATLGPFLANSVQNLMNAQGSTGMLGQQAAYETNKGDQMMTKATTGSGLFKSQQAEVNQAVQTQQSQVAQQLASEGLGNSTLKASLQGQAKMSGAAAAGQLIQGNIQLAEGEQQLGTAAQQALFNQFSSIASMSASLQSQVWNQAMQGFGEMGQMMQQTVNAFGYGLQTQQDIEQVATQNANLQASTNSTNAGIASQQASSSSSMFAGLGQLLGGSGGGGSGGLLGGLGGILGSTGSAGALGSMAADGTIGATSLATTGSGILGGASGLISGIGTALGALFCEVARTVYGVDSPDWLLFRDWILFRAPKPVRTAYAVHAYRVSRWIKGRPIICGLIRRIMNAILYVDSLIP
jgi:hypothetical protein